MLGFVADYVETPGRGEIGMGLGVKSRAGVRVLLRNEQELSIDGTDVGASVVTAPLPEEIRRMTGKAHAYGVTIRIAQQALEVTVRAGPERAARPLALRLPLTADQRARLLSGSMAVLSRDGRHHITPFLDP